MDLNTSTYEINKYLIRLKSFIDELGTNKSLKTTLIIKHTIIMFILIAGALFFENEHFRRFLFIVTGIFLWLLLSMFEIFYFGHGFTNKRCVNGFQKIGLHNKLYEYPILKSKYISNDGKIILSFYRSGIAREIWEEYLLKLENVFNVSICEIRLGGRNDIIIVKCFKGKFDWINSTPWSNDYIPKGDKFIVGNTITGFEQIDINSFPHILIGGMTGSGKTVLLKQFLLQCIAKKYNVYIADFKLGVDYPTAWKTRCTFLTSRHEIISTLKDVTEEMEKRQTLLSDVGCNNISIYNDKYDKKIPRVVFACDELAELLDSTGMDKDDKVQIKEIEGYISKIARLGRASGIHLILATQRPDADILNGQIKSNMTYRLCGRANDVLSRIILDTTDAAKLIPADSKGVFINQDGIRVKGLNVKDADIETI